MCEREREQISNVMLAQKHIMNIYVYTCSITQRQLYLFITRRRRKKQQQQVLLLFNTIFVSPKQSVYI